MIESSTTSSKIVNEEENMGVLVLCYYVDYLSFILCSMQINWFGSLEIRVKIFGTLLFSLDVLCFGICFQSLCIYVSDRHFTTENYVYFKDTQSASQICPLVRKILRGLVKESAINC